MLRLNDDREKLRQRILQLEIDTQKHLNLQRTQLDQQFADQAGSMKQLHRAEVETLESEIRKLKSLIDAKNEEIERLI
jgi:predicted component of type VI protein secretion system